VNPSCLLRLVSLTLLASTPLHAQNVLAYPQDGTGTGSGNLVPMGYSTSANFDEGRYQILVPADHMPVPGAIITALEVFTIPGTAAITYPSLELRLSHFVGTTLNPTFASNLPTPVLAYSQQAVTINWTTRQWVPLTFQTPFVYDGISDLVVDIQKVVTQGSAAIVSHGTESRSDLPRVLYAFGPLGSGANTSASGSFTSSNILKFRLRVVAPTMVLRSDPTGSVGPFALTNTFDASVHAVPNTLQVTLASQGYAPVGTIFSPLLGFQHVDLNNSATFSIGGVPASGISTVTLTLPNDPNLVGLKFVFQAATLNSSLIQPAWTNASDFVIN